MPETQDDVSEPLWFTGPANGAPATAAPPSADAAAPGSATLMGERFNSNARSWLESADEAFPVAPQVIQLFVDVVGKIDQGVADGSISGDDKEKFDELADKYSAIWDDYDSRSAESARQDNTDHLERAAEDMKALSQDHPDFDRQIPSQAPSTDVMVDVVDVATDLGESNLERAKHYTTDFLDGAQIILDCTREAAEIRSHQDGADTEAMHDALQRADKLQSDLDNAYDAADRHLDQNTDALEKWRDESEQYIKDHPNPTQTSEGFTDQPKVTVNIASPDATGRLIHEAQADVATVYAAADDAGHEGSAGVAVAVAVAEPDHVATHDSSTDSHGADAGVAPDAGEPVHGAAAETTLEECSV